MTNPERKNGRTPNGGVVSEIWYFDAFGNVAQRMEEATKCKINEYDAAGRLVGTTYGEIEQGG